MTAGTAACQRCCSAKHQWHADLGLHPPMPVDQARNNRPAGRCPQATDVLQTLHVTVRTDGYARACSDEPVDTAGEHGAGRGCHILTNELDLQLHAVCHAHTNEIGRCSARAFGAPTSCLCRQEVLLQCRMRECTDRCPVRLFPR
jgi:hypothetical protein